MSRIFEKTKSDIVNYGNILMKKTFVSIKDIEKIDTLISLLYSLKHSIEKRCRDKIDIKKS